MMTTRNEGWLCKASVIMPATVSSSHKEGNASKGSMKM